MIVAAAAAVLVTMKALAARPPAVSAEPALNPNQPNHSRPAPRTVIGTSCGVIASPFLWRRADQDGDDEGRDARAEVDDRAAGEVERSELEQPAVGRPDPVRDRRVDEDRPEDREQDEGAEPLALGERAGDEGRRDRREHQLEGGEQHERDGHRIDRARLEADAVEHREVEATDQAQSVDVRPEGEREPDDDPDDAHQRQSEEAVHDRREHVLAADEATVEQGQTRQHDHDQGRRHQQPGGIPTIHSTRPPHVAARGHARTCAEGYESASFSAAPRQDRQGSGSVPDARPHAAGGCSWESLDHAASDGFERQDGSNL